MTVSPVPSLSSRPILIYPPSYFAAMERDGQMIKSGADPNNLAERLSIVPEFPIAHPKEVYDDSRRYYFVTELFSHMNAYWDHFRDVALEKEMLLRLYKRKQTQRLEERIVFDRIDLLQAYIISMLFERVFLNSLMQRRLLYEASLQRQSTLPLRYTVHRPNQIKVIDLLRLATLENQSLRGESISLSQRHGLLMPYYFGQGWTQAMTQIQGALQRNQAAQVLAGLKSLLNQFASGWQKNWQHHAGFRAMVADHFLLRASYFPELWQATGQHPAQLDKKISNHAASIQSLLHNQPFWRELAADLSPPSSVEKLSSALATQEILKQAQTANHSQKKAYFHYLDKVAHDHSVQPLLKEKVQREWHMSQHTAVHQAAVKNAQFETALADSYGFIGKRLSERQSLMEAALQVQKNAEAIAPQQTLLNQPDMQYLHQIHFEICKHLAGLDYAASQQLAARNERLLAENNASQNHEELTRICRVKKAAPS